MCIDHRKVDLGKKIDLLRETSHSLLAYKYERRSSEEWSKFWGCLDTLRDMDSAILELLRLSREPTRAECIGFLQILYSQQDAIYHLCQNVGVAWKPDNNILLLKIRELRNRITAHSAWAGRNKDGVPSTSMINWHDIRVGGFKAVVYRQEKSDDMPLYEDIDFANLTKDNLVELLEPIGIIIDKMNENEDSLKLKLRDLDWQFLDNQGDGYLLEKMWGPWEHENNRLWQAQGHAKQFRDRLQKAKTFFADNHVYEVDEYALKALIAGIEKIQEYLNNHSPSEDEALQYYVLLRGWSKLWGEFDEELSTLKNKIGIE